jgi:hypothetical protein
MPSVVLRERVRISMVGAPSLGLGFWIDELEGVGPQGSEVSG